MESCAFGHQNGIGLVCHVSSARIDIPGNEEGGERLARVGVCFFVYLILFRTRRRPHLCSDDGS